MLAKLRNMPSISKLLQCNPLRITTMILLFLLIIWCVCASYFYSGTRTGEGTEILADRPTKIENNKEPTKEPFEGNGSASLVEMSTKSENKKEVLLMLWTPFLGDPNWRLGKILGKTPFDRKKCPDKNCIVTTDKSQVEFADIVLFHCRDKERFFWPKVRTSKQAYAGYCWEAPTNSNFAEYGNRLNMSVTYRLDSDLLDSERISPRETRLPGEYVPRIRFADKTLNIVWTVSHCATLSKREQYVHKLQEHIHVHIYGRCGALKCPKGQQQFYTKNEELAGNRSSECFKIFEKKYKFFLAFENNVLITSRRSYSNHYITN